MRSSVPHPANRYELRPPAKRMLYLVKNNRNSSCKVLSPKFRDQFCLSFGKPISMNDDFNFTIKEFNNLLYERMLEEEKIALKNVGR